MAVPPRPRVPRKQCYFAGCTAPATTDDHVPAKVFFPEADDVGGLDYRQNLFSVRSCSAHNNVYSDDEDFVAFSMLGNIENGPVSGAQWATKLMRALAQSEGMKERFRSAMQMVSVDGAPPRPSLKIDNVAVSRVMQKIARGLHYRLTGARLHASEIMVTPLGHVATTRDAAEGAATMMHALDGVTDWQAAGHADVFQYKHWPAAQQGTHAVFAFRFYGGTDVVVTARHGAP